MVSTELGEVFALFQMKMHETNVCFAERLFNSARIDFLHVRIPDTWLVDGDGVRDGDGDGDDRPCTVQVRKQRRKE